MVTFKVMGAPEKKWPGFEIFGEIDIGDIHSSSARRAMTEGKRCFEIRTTAILQYLHFTSVEKGPTFGKLQEASGRRVAEESSFVHLV